MHKWIQRHWLKAGICENCGETRYTEWAEKNHGAMIRERTHWMELCKPCHERYDIAHHGKLQGRAASR